MDPDAISRILLERTAELDHAIETTHPTNGRSELLLARSNLYLALLMNEIRGPLSGFIERLDVTVVDDDPVSVTGSCETEIPERDGFCGPCGG
jgi:hypothetical protein